MNKSSTVGGVYYRLPSKTEGEGKLKVVKYIPGISKKQVSVTHNYFSHQ